MGRDKRQGGREEKGSRREREEKGKS